MSIHVNRAQSPVDPSLDRVIYEADEGQGPEVIGVAYEQTSRPPESKRNYTRRLFETLVAFLVGLILGASL